MSDLDLLGAPVERAGARTDAERKRERRRAQDKPKGYFKRPGSGPASETCGTCANAVCNRTYRRNYWKCAFVKPTRGPGSDIVLKSPACAAWQEKGEETES